MAEDRYTQYLDSPMRTHTAEEEVSSFSNNNNNNNMKISVKSDEKLFYSADNFRVDDDSLSYRINRNLHIVMVRIIVTCPR